jgi:ABC-type glycerol-3-phosphate transport system substrate-binding protein
MYRADWLPRYQKNLKPAPVAVFNAEEYKRTFAGITARDLLRGGEVYGVSYGIPTLGLFYNTQLFEAAGLNDPPKTWQEVVDMNAKLSQKEGQNLFKSGIALGTANVSAASSIMPMLMMQNGAKMTDDPPTKATFEEPSVDGYQASPKALSFYNSFALPSKSTYSWSDALGDSNQAFALGKTAMIVQYPYRYQDIKAQNPNLQFKMAKLPQVNPDSPLNYSEYWAEGVSAASKHPDIAWDFYNFMTTYQIMNQYSVPTMKPASRLDLAEAQRQDSLLGPFAEQVPSAQGYYKGNNVATDAAILEMIQTSLAGFDPMIAVRGASNKVTQSIKQFPY